MTPSERNLRRAAILTAVEWLAIRRANSTRILEFLGTPSEETLDRLIDRDYEILMTVVGDAIVKELEFLSEKDFPGVACVPVDDPEEVPPGVSIN